MVERARDAAWVGDRLGVKRRRLLKRRADAGLRVGPQLDREGAMKALSGVSDEVLERVTEECRVLVEKCIDMRWAGFDVAEFERRLRRTLVACVYVVRARRKVAALGRNGRDVVGGAVGAGGEPSRPSERQRTIMEWIECGAVVLRWDDEASKWAVDGSGASVEVCARVQEAGRSIDLLIERGMLWKDEYGYLVVTESGLTSLIKYT